MPNDKSSFIIAVPAACIIVDQFPGHEGDSVVFIEYKNNSRGQLVSGHYPGKLLDGEEYAYDAENSLLTSCAGNFDFNGSMKALVGTTQSLMQDAGYGVSTSLSSIYSYPQAVCGIKIDTVFDDGTVILTYNGSSITLSPGQRWVRVYTENLETDDYRVKMTNTEIIRNNGKIRLASLRT
jgi:hypothetical protein